MKHIIHNLTISASKLDRRHLQLLLLVLTLSLFVLGAGAPGAGGSPGGF